MSPAYRPMHAFPRGVLVTLFVMALAACGGGSGSDTQVLAPQAQEGQTLMGFRQESGLLTLEFDALSGPVTFLNLPSVPATIDGAALRPLAVRAGAGDERKDNDASIPLRDEPTEGEYSVIVFTGSGYLELIRQSGTWLDRTFAFARPDGYTILGRRTVQVASGPNPEYEPLGVVGRPSIEVAPVPVSQYEEINLAAGLLRWMLQEPFRMGPTSRSYTEFLQHPFEEKLRRMREGEFSVSCTGLRDLFAHAAAATPPLKVRLVEAWNYAPHLPDLIPYAHSTMELWLEQAGKWALFDPWLGVIVLRNGVPAGAAELNAFSADDRYSTVPIVGSVPRMYAGSAGQVTYKPFDPRTLSLDGFACEPLGCAPGYREYFRHYVARPVQIQ